MGQGRCSSKGTLKGYTFVIIKQTNLIINQCILEYSMYEYI